jgi:hypothetical protein
MPVINDLEIDPYFYESIRIEPLALQEEFVRQPMDLAYWNERLKETLEVFLCAKRDHEELRAKARLILREQFTAEGRKATEADLEAAVTLDEEVRAARQAFILAEVDQAQARGRAQAVETKRGMLMMLGAQIRTEMESDPVIRHMAGNARKARLANEGG